MSSKGDINRRVLAIQAKKKRKNPKGGRKPGNAVYKDDKDGPPTPGGGARENAANINGQSRETRSAQPRSETRPPEDDEEEEEEILGSDDDEQEDPKDYVKGGYHPVKIGDLFHNRYHVVRKLGWGHFSTVWLCWDLNDKKFVALKVVKSAAHYTETALDEIKLLKCVRESDEADPYRERCVQLLDDFKISGVNGTHVCMVFEVLGHNLLKFIIRSNYQGIPLYNVKLIMKQVFEGLHYLHTKCKIIHTDIKPENVLICVDESHIRKIAADATYFHKMGMKLPGSAVSTAPKELREVDMNAKMSKSKKKKLKKRAKRNQALMEETMQHIEEVEREEQMQETDTKATVNGGAGIAGSSPASSGPDREAAPTSNNSTTKLADIEKRKSFADMKLAEVGSMGGQQWNFENLPEEPSTPCDEADEDTEAAAAVDNLNSSLEAADNYKNGGDNSILEDVEDENEDMQCNGHEGSEVVYDQTNGAAVIANTENPVDCDGLEASEAEAEADVNNEQPLTDNADMNERARNNSDREGRPTVFSSSMTENKIDPVTEIAPDLQVKIADLGNACWVTHHFTEDIQTRQYRSLEVLLGAGYGSPADIWSAACMAFELATGDYLFEPHSGEDYSRDEDHLAHVIELIQPIPRHIAFSGKYSREFFNKRGELRHITKLKPWGLYDVLVEKYEWDPEVAQSFADWLLPMLNFDTAERATAEECLRHSFLQDA